MDYMSRSGAKRQSNGEWKFKCPITDRHATGDARPSAFYSENKQSWHCFGCGCSGGLLVGDYPLVRVISNGITLSTDAIRRELDASKDRVNDHVASIYQERTWQRALLARHDILDRLQADGISEDACTYFDLGLGEHYGKLALYIPWTISGELQAVQYRFLDDARGSRYVFEKGTMGSIFNGDCLSDPVDDYVIITEGAKKTAALWSAGFKSVCGLVSKSTWKDHYKHWFDRVGRVIVALDPDAEAEAHSIAQAVKHGRVARLPAKPDDFLVHDLGGDTEAFWRWLEYARPVKDS